MTNLDFIQNNILTLHNNITYKYLRRTDRGVNCYDRSCKRLPLKVRPICSYGQIECYT